MLHSLRAFMEGDNPEGDLWVGSRSIAESDSYIPEECACPIKCPLSASQFSPCAAKIHAGNWSDTDDAPKFPTTS